jgi:DNA recombination protein RmuC
MTLDTVLFQLGDLPVTVVLAAAVIAGLIGLLLLVLLIGALRAGRARAAEAAAVLARSADLEKSLRDVASAQSEMHGRMQTMSEIFGTNTSNLARLVSERLDAQGQRVGQAIEATNKKNEDSLTRLNERLAVIDRAQTTIAQLSGEIVSLQSILSNKQTRGAFGQGRMEAIVGDGLPAGGYAFQATLNNGSRPDCLIYMPNGAPPLVIDAKFPLESWQRLTSAQTPEETRQAQTGFKGDMGVHIRAISEKYLIAGETQDTAFLFVPSESIFADLHEQFEDVVQRASRARVVVVSPSILMLSIQVVQALLRDVRIREEAHRIQKEVRDLLGDITRLDDRTRKLQAHFAQANSDIGDILTSTGKIARRGERIDAMEFEEPRDRLPGI